MEEAPVSDFEEEERLRHPYTKALFRAMPQHGFVPVSGSQPYGKEFLSGCPYASRCELADGTCGKEVEYTSLRGGMVRCRKAAEGGNGRYEAGGESALFSI